MIKIIQTIVLTAVVFSPLSLISLATSATAHHTSSHVSTLAVATTKTPKKGVKKGKKQTTSGTTQKKPRTAAKTQQYKWIFVSTEGNNEMNRWAKLKPDRDLSRSGFKFLWSWAESNCRPPWVLTFRSFTGIVYLILKTGVTNCPRSQDALMNLSYLAHQRKLNKASVEGYL